LCDQEQQGSSVVRFRLPYTFNIVAKRNRDQLELEDRDSLPAPPRRKICRRVPHNNSFVRTATPCTVRPSELSTRPSGSLHDVGVIPSQTNNPTLPPTSAQGRVSPTPHAGPSRPLHAPVPSATFEGTMDGQGAVIEGTNPGRGPTTGGLEIWIYGSNLPNSPRPVYARFGDNVTRVVSTMKPFERLILI